MSATGGWVETYRGTVFRWEVDNNDHLTVAYYFARIGDAAVAFLEATGLGRGREPGIRSRDVTVDCYVRYLRELRVGDILHMVSGLIRIDGNRLVLGHKLLNSETGELCTTVEQEIATVDAESGAPLPFARAQEAEAASRQVTWDGPPRERRPVPPALDGFRDSARDTVKPWELDVSGPSGLSWYIHRFSAANAHAIAVFGLTPGYLRRERRGFSTFEFQLALAPPPAGGDPLVRPGDPVVVRSALLHVGTSSLRVVHVMLNARTGGRIAALEQFGVHLDLDARRPVPLPAALHENARAALVPTA